MHLTRTERVCSNAVRNLLSLASRDIEPRRIVLQRLDAHLNRHRYRPRFQSLTTTTTRRQHEIQLAQSPSEGAVSPQPIVRGSSHDAHAVVLTQRHFLPVSCPGCGALTQESESDSPGFYSRSRRAVRRYLKQQKAQNLVSQEDPVEDIEGDNAGPDNETLSLIHI